MKNILLAFILSAGSLVFAREKTKIAVMDLKAREGISGGCAVVFGITFAF